MIGRALARFPVLTLAASMLAGCATITPYVPPQPVLVDITREGDIWRAHYTMPKDSPIWAMHRSGADAATGEPWRPASWRVVTPGVALQRIGDHDALVALKGTVPRDVTVEFDVPDIDVRFDHDPAVRMSNGSLALFTGYFSAFPMDEVEELRTLDGVYRQSTEMRFRDEGRQVIHNGAPVDTAVFKDDGYVVFGPVTLTNATRGDTIIDPGLPEWLAAEVDSFTTRALAEYSQRIGVDPRGRPVLVAAWEGPVPGITRTAGTAVGTTLTMRFAGQGFETRNYPALVYAQRLIAHEAAHIWLGQLVGSQGRGNRWITEGGATLLAVRMQEALDAEVNGADAIGFGTTQRLAELVEGRQPYAITDYLATARAECPAWLEAGPLGTAHERIEEDAFYDCGTVFALAIEQAGTPRGEDFFDFVALLVEQNPDGVVLRAEWLDAARDFGLDQAKVALIEDLLENGAADGKIAVERLLADPAA